KERIRCNCVRDVDSSFTHIREHDRRDTSAQRPSRNERIERLILIGDHNRVWTTKRTAHRIGIVSDTESRTDDGLFVHSVRQADARRKHYWNGMGAGIAWNVSAPTEEDFIGRDVPTLNAELTAIHNGIVL